MSAFVLPERMPAREHGQQPMFPDDERALLALAMKALELYEARRGDQPEMPDHRDGADQVGRVVRRYRPQNKELREYATGRAFFQRLERDIRRDLHLKPEDEVTHEMVYAAGGPSPKTQGRIMTQTYFLRAQQWPPSTWPEEPPTTSTDK